MGISNVTTFLAHEVKRRRWAANELAKRRKGDWEKVRSPGDWVAK